MSVILTLKVLISGTTGRIASVYNKHSDISLPVDQNVRDN